MEEVRYEVRRKPGGEEFLELMAAAWGNPGPDFGPVLERSFTWVTARVADRLVGFVNVAWDGGVHFFLLDTSVHPDWRHRGIGQRLVREAIAACEGHGDWLHVDADDALMDDFYRPCGFIPTPAGLVNLRAGSATAPA